MAKTRRQLTFFLCEQTSLIERIREEFNPEQFRLIPSHVTLCREDEIEPLGKVRENLQALQLSAPIRIMFSPIKRSADGKGVYLPGAGENKPFHEVRKVLLKGMVEQPGNLQPHITLMHPRNSTCTDKIFHQLTQMPFPSELTFGKISLIEQKSGGKWNILEEYPIIK